MNKSIEQCWMNNEHNYKIKWRPNIDLQKF
jgi:hypothetical protein